MTPADALKWAEEKMLPYYPLGEFKTPEAGRITAGGGGKKDAE
jgi:2-oxoglutarate ferredoxin oxidoreductase subunit beta